jgi:hypothetical protein
VSRKRKFLESKCNGSILPENAFYRLCPWVIATLQHRCYSGSSWICWLYRRGRH